MPAENGLRHDAADVGAGEQDDGADETDDGAGPARRGARLRRARGSHSSTTSRRSRRAPRPADWRGRWSEIPGRDRRTSAAPPPGSTRRAAARWPSRRRTSRSRRCYRRSRPNRLAAASPQLAGHHSVSSPRLGRNQALRTASSATSRTGCRPAATRKDEERDRQARDSPVSSGRAAEWRRRTAGRSRICGP